jgi:di/tricarboxylate transporter
MIPVMLISAFVNNIPIVATLIPNIKKWAHKNNFPVSKLLIPLSYAAISGGMCTLIGTSTNLIIHGLLIDYDLPGLGFFELSKIGLPIALIVILYVTFIGQKIIPAYRDNLILFNESTREFVVEVKIEQTYPNIGKTIEQANLRHLKGLFLFQIVRKNREIAPVQPDEKIHLYDRLFFTGIPETIFDMVKTPGFHIIKDHDFDLANIDSDKYQTYEAVISNNSSLVGNNVRESKFRNKYNAVILAIHRNGHRINKKIGDIIFQSGDTLFMLGRKNFGKQWYNSQDFSLVSESISDYSKPKSKGNLALLLVVLMIVSVVTGIIESLLVAALVITGVMFMTRIISIYDAKRSIDFNVLLVIVSSLGIAQAVANSGVSEQIAISFTHLFGRFGEIGIIAGLFIITSLTTEIISNNAAAALLFPIIISIASQMNIDLRPLVLTIAIAASTSFSTPIGYQTNLMIYSPGGYKFFDYLKIGLPLNIITCIITTILIVVLF